MSIDHVSQNIQIENILRRSREELQWGDYSDMGKVDVFEVWTIRDNYEIDRIGSHVEYTEAVASSELMILIMEAGTRASIIRSVVVWVFRNSEEDSVLEVGIAKRKDDGS